MGRESLECFITKEGAPPKPPPRLPASPDPSGPQWEKKATRKLLCRGGGGGGTGTVRRRPSLPGVRVLAVHVCLLPLRLVWHGFTRTSALFMDHT